MTDKIEHTEDIHASYIHWVADASAYRLAELAGCGAPDSATSPGAEILTEVRDAVVERWRTGCSGNGFDWESSNTDGDLISECADEGIIPPGSHDRALLFVELCAYAEVNEHTTHDKWGPGSFEDMMVEAIGQITYRLASALVTDLRKDFDELWECPGCGDSGSPHLCLPGLCDGSDEDKAAQTARLAECAAYEAAKRDTSATQADQVAPQDPILDLIAQVEAERASGTLDSDGTFTQDDKGQWHEVKSPSDTQAFMSYMTRVNAEEFGPAKPFGWPVSRWVGLIGLLTAIALVAWVVWAS